MNKSPNNFYNRICEIMKFRRVTEEDLISGTNLSPTKMNYLKRGNLARINAIEALEIAQYLNVSVDYLYGISEDDEKISLMDLFIKVINKMQDADASVDKNELLKSEVTNVINKLQQEGKTVDKHEIDMIVELLKE